MTDAAASRTLDPTENVKALMHAAVESLRREMELRAHYEDKLREAEAGRLDAIRLVDTQSAQASDSRATEQAAVLASQVTSTAEALAAQFRQEVASLNSRIVALERASYEGAGRSGVTDPAMDALLMRVDSLRTQQATAAGTSLGAKELWAYVIGAVGIAVAVANFLAS